MVIPVLLVILSYVSCEKEAAIIDNEQSLNLEQYSYTLVGGDFEMSPENKIIHQKHEAFLMDNPDFVSWAKIDRETSSISYSVHHKDEQPDFKYVELDANLPNDKSYKIYLNLESKSESLVVTEKEEIDPRDYDGEPEVPYSVIDQAPTFEVCANEVDEKSRKECTSREVAKFVNKNFNVNLASSLGLVGRQRISVFFKIDKDGSVTDIKARAPHPGLEEEAKRVVSLLPKMNPGIHAEKTVVVPYSLPIVFQIAE